MLYPGFFESSDSESDTSVVSPPYSSLSDSDSYSLSQSQIDLLFDDGEDEQADEPANIAPPTIGDTAELPSLGDLSATIEELSATLMDISSSVPQTSTDLPTIGELSATIQELSVAISQISSNGDALAFYHSQPVSLPPVGPQPVNLTPVSLQVSSDPVNLQVSSDPVNVQVSSDPANLQVSSDPVNLQVSSDPVNLQVSSDPANLQVSSDPVNLLVSSDPVNSHPVSQQPQKWSGFKLVGDNIDKNFRRSFYRHNRQTISMHAFHMYAVKDRIDLSSLSDIAPSDAKVDITKLLIHQTDIDGLKSQVVSNSMLQLILFC